MLSVSGDCHSPGVFEVPFGITLAEVLNLAGAEEAAAVQVGGPSGQLVGPADFERKICYDDLATGGSIMVFGPERDVLEVADSFMRFFIHESCGYCTPCRVGAVLLHERLRKIIDGKGQPADLDYLADLGEIVKKASRCGLGQTAANPVLSTLRNFREAYESRVSEEPDGFEPGFDLARAVGDAAAIARREPVHAE